MTSGFRRLEVPMSIGYGLSITLLSLFLLDAPLRAEEAGSVHVVYRPFDANVAKGTFAVSFVKDGKIVFQDEKTPYCPKDDCQTITRNQYIPYKIAPGSYDVRVEGQGVVTVVKQGVAVISGKTREISFDLRPGQGVKITEYATGGLSREEIAARIKKLEEAVESLKAKK